MPFKIDYKSSDLDKGIDKMAVKMGALLMMYSSTKASKIQSEMKIKRVWTDRTGAAKALLNVKVSQPDLNTIRLTLAHGVDYGIWLELANEGNYAIIKPTINAEGPRIVTDLDNIMGKIKL